MSFLRARASYLIWSGLLLLFGLVGSGAFLAAHSVQTTRTWVTQSHEVINSTKDLLADALDAETSQRGYLITGNRAYLLPYEQATERITVTLSKLRQLTSDNPDQLHNLDQLAGSIQRKMQELARNPPVGAAFRLEASRGNACSLTGKFMGTHDDGCGSVWAGATAAVDVGKEAAECRGEPGT